MFPYERSCSQAWPLGVGRPYTPTSGCPPEGSSTQKSQAQALGLGSESTKEGMAEMGHKREFPNLWPSRGAVLGRTRAGRGRLSVFPASATC